MAKRKSGKRRSKNVLRRKRKRNLTSKRKKRTVTSRKPRKNNRRRKRTQRGGFIFSPFDLMKATTLAIPRAFAKVAPTKDPAIKKLLSKF